MKQKGLWKYAKKLKPYVEEKNRFTLGEGNTPLKEDKGLAKILKLEKIYLKREDLNPTGSHKDRGLAFQISIHIQEGKKEFAISSSGNSAISAINILKNTNYPLHIFLSSKLSVSKINRLVKSLNGKISSEIFKGENTNFENLHFYFSQKPLSNLIAFTRNKETTSLRGSTDKYGYEGFKTITYEIDVEADSIFIPTSSGTTAKGIYEGFDKLIPFHLIQTTKINTLVNKYDKNYTPSLKSHAESIVDRVGHRIKEIEDIIQKSNGTGWIIGNREIENAQKILKSQNIITSNESALTIAAIIKAKEKNWDIQKAICIFTGTI